MNLADCQGAMDVVREIGTQLRQMGFSIWQLFGLLMALIVAWGWRGASAPLIRLGFRRRTRPPQ